MSYMLMSAAHRHRTSVFYCVHHNALYYVNTSTNLSDSDLDGRLHTVCSPRRAPILIVFVLPCLKVVMCDRVDLFTRKLYIAAHHVVINARITAFRGRARVVITLRRPSSHISHMHIMSLRFSVGRVAVCCHQPRCCDRQSCAMRCDVPSHVNCIPYMTYIHCRLQI